MENRYAIIIGINDYENDPLSFCVNDGMEVKNELIKRAGFESENIHTILSSKESPVKDITGMLFNAITKISETFIPGEDSIFFHYAGHGVYSNDESQLVFHDSNFPIKGVFEKIKDLNPKLQFLVIDACESGGKTLSRGIGKDITNLNLDEFISASSGIMLLYACQNTEKAFEVDQVQHGIMTYYLIEAIRKDALYDEDGVLTPGRIQEYVSKNVARKTNFMQNPVVESRITGFYPFAQLSGVCAASVIDQRLESQPREVGSSEIEVISYDRNSRLKLQTLALTRVKAILNDMSSDNDNNYDFSYFSSVNELPVKNSRTLLERIVSDASNKLNAIKNTIYYNKIPIYESKGSWPTSIATIMGEKVVKEYKDEPEINYKSEYLSFISLIGKSKSIERVSYGVGCILYQAKWGLVLSPFCILIDWDGEEDCLISTIRKENFAFLINNESIQKATNLEIEMFNNIKSLLNVWNSKRKEELDSFEIIKKK